VKEREEKEEEPDDDQDQFKWFYTMKKMESLQCVKKTVQQYRMEQREI
jgi:hypothetical protein